MLRSTLPLCNRSTILLRSHLPQMIANQLYILNDNVQSRNVRTIVSKNLQDAHFHVFKLFRKAIKLVPFMKDVYHLPFEETDMRRVIRGYFEKNRQIRNKGVIDSLVTRGSNDIEEIQMHHKQRGHVFHFFETSEHLGKPTHQLETSVHARDKAILEEFGVAVDLDQLSIMEQFDAQVRQLHTPVLNLRNKRFKRIQEGKQTA